MERYLVVIFCGVMGGLAAHRCHFPGGAVVGAMLASGLATLAMPDGVSIPKNWGIAIQLVLGISLGMSFNRTVLPLAAKALPLAVASTVILLTVAFCMALIAHKLGMVDFGTALFGFSPGGMSGMAFLAQAEGHKAPVVAFFHLVRIFTLFLCVPIIARLYFMFGPGR